MSDGSSALLGYTVPMNVGKYGTEDRLKIHKRNTTTKSKQCKTQQHNTTLGLQYNTSVTIQYSYDTESGNEVGLFYNARELCQLVLLFAAIEMSCW